MRSRLEAFKPWKSLSLTAASGKLLTTTTTTPRNFKTVGKPLLETDSLYVFHWFKLISALCTAYCAVGYSPLPIVVFFIFFFCWAAINSAHCQLTSAGAPARNAVSTRAALVACVLHASENIPWRAHSHAVRRKGNGIYYTCSIYMAYLILKIAAPAGYKVRCMWPK